MASSVLEQCAPNDEVMEAAEIHKEIGKPEPGRLVGGLYALCLVM